MPTRASWGRPVDDEGHYIGSLAAEPRPDDPSKHPLELVRSPFGFEYWASFDGRSTPPDADPEDVWIHLEPDQPGYMNRGGTLRGLADHFSEPIVRNLRAMLIAALERRRQASASAEPAREGGAARGTPAALDRPGAASREAD
jgi:hypothetical protein